MFRLVIISAFVIYFLFLIKLSQVRIELAYVSRPPGVDCNAVLQQAGEGETGIKLWASYEYDAYKNTIDQGFLTGLTTGMNARL
jgi:hypothetical protein